MIALALYFAFGCLGLSLLFCMWRLISAPTVGDRILALDTMVINGIGLIILFGVAGSTQAFFEAGLIIAMLGFVSTVAYCRFLLRGDIIE